MSTGTIAVTLAVAAHGSGLSGATTKTIRKLVLGRFNDGQKLVDPETGTGTVVFVRYLNDSIANLQAALNAVTSQVNDITEALRQAGIAIDTANTAAANANAAAAAAQSAVSDASLSNSYVNPANALSAAIDTGDATKASITIASHNRVYGNGTSVAVSGATLHGLALSTLYYIVYQDAARTGGTVVFSAITDSSLAGQSGAQHLVGSVTTPASGATTPVTGGTVRPPGVGSIKKFGDEGLDDGV